MPRVIPRLKKNRNPKLGRRLGKIDPTRTISLRNAFALEMRRRFNILKGHIFKLIADEDALGLKDVSPYVGNAFCPTGLGGGQDNSCSPVKGGSREASIKEQVDKIAFVNDSRIGSNDPIPDTTWVTGDSDSLQRYKFITPKGREYQIGVYTKSPGKIEMEFVDDKGRVRMTGESGPGEARAVLTEVTTAMAAYVEKFKPEVIEYSAAGESRQAVYDRLSKSIAKLSPEYSAAAYDHAGLRMYTVVKRSVRDEEFSRLRERITRRGEDPASMEVLVNARFEWFQPELNPEWFVDNLSSTQFNIRTMAVVARLRQLQSLIDPDDIIELEDQPHITVRYGLHGQEAKPVQSLYRNQVPIRVKLGGLSLFPAGDPSSLRGGPEFDVLKIDVESRQLGALHKRLGILPNTSTHPVYHPHITVAYLKPGTGIKYVGESGLEGKELTFDELVFSDDDRNHTPLENAFCPTGPGGGQDNSCSSTGGVGKTFATMPPGKATSKEAKVWRKQNQKRYDTDREFKAVVDAVTLYTQGDYAHMRAFAEKSVTGSLPSLYKDSSLSKWDDKPISMNPLSAVKTYFEGQNLKADDDLSKNVSYSEAGRLLQEAVSTAPPSEVSLYRGIVGYSAEMAALQPGDHFNILAPSSFSVDRQVGHQFAKGINKGQGRGKSWSKFGVLLEVEPGARALPVSALSPWDQKEVLTTGQFTVKSVEEGHDGVLRVKMSQSHPRPLVLNVEGEEIRWAFEQASPFPLELVANTRWKFRTSAQKVEEFRKWLARQANLDILGNTQAEIDEGWWESYIQQGFAKGAGRSWMDIKKPYLGDKDQIDVFRGTLKEFLRASFAKPVTKEKVKLLAGRTFTDLKGVTDTMSTQLTRALTDGLVQGKGPLAIAKDITQRVDGIGRVRAESIARTEIIRAHAEGQLQAMEDLGVEEVGVAVEWSTAGDDRVCPLCEAMEGVVFKVAEAHNMIPRHPMCRCSFIPANVGEDNEGQKRSKSSIQTAIKRSIRREGREDPDDTTWQGADADIAKKRPKSIFNNVVIPELDAFSEFIVNVYCATGPGGGVDPSCDKGSAKFVGARVDAKVHSHAESAKHSVAKAIGGVPEEKTKDRGQRDKKPYDVQLRVKGQVHDIEVKTMTVGAKQQISVHPDALLRKYEHSRDTGSTFHTVVIDDRENYEGGANAENYSGNRIYYKRGSGRYSLSQMQPVETMRELRKLITTDSRALPEKARGSLPPPPPVRALKEQAEATYQARTARDSVRKERNKDLLREQARARRERRGR